MHRHGPSLLKGPVTRSREWWASFVKEDSWGGTAVAEPGDDPPSRSDTDVRWELVDRVRRELAEGTYETPEKWQAALDRLRKRLEE